MKFESLGKFISSYSFDSSKNDAISRILPSLESIPAKEWFAHCKEIMKGFGFDSGRNTALRLLITKCVAPLFVSSDALENVLNKFGFDSGRIDALRTFAAAKIQFENNGIDALSSFSFESHKNTALGILFGGDSLNDDKKVNVSDDYDDDEEDEEVEEDEEDEDTDADGDEDIDDKIDAGKRSSSMAGNARNSSCVSNYAAGVLPLSAAAVSCASSASSAAVSCASSASSVAVSSSLSVESNVVEHVLVAKNNDLIKELIGADEIAQEQKEECVICNERKCKVLLEPCNHVILCNTCARGVAAPFDCAKCRKRVTKAKTIFL